MRFERKHYGESSPERGTVGVFKRKIRGWMTAPEGVDYCPSCWQAEKNTPPLSKQVKDASRPTSEFAEQREGTDGWSVICQACGKEAFVKRA